MKHRLLDQHARNETVNRETKSPDVAAPAVTDGAALLRVTRPEKGVSVITLNASASRNSLSRPMMSALEAAIAELGCDAAIAAIVITAEGPPFCAGPALKELPRHRADADGGRGFYTDTMQACAQLMQSIVHCPKPVIAAVQGIATAAGCQLVATCDLAVASSTAKFATPGVNIGLFCSTPMVALSRNVSRKRAMEMLLLGEMLDAEDAERYGLVNRVVPPERVRDEAMGMARIIASKSPVTVAIGKEAFYRQVEQPLAEAYAYAASVMVENMMTRDAAEGIGAFIEKRPPIWES